nr:hypothetical protein Iba_chr14cCG5650 [Ipomoea batatas]
MLRSPAERCGHPMPEEIDTVVTVMCEIIPVHSSSYRSLEPNGSSRNRPSPRTASSGFERIHLVSSRLAGVDVNEAKASFQPTIAAISSRLLTFSNLYSCFSDLFFSTNSPPSITSDEEWLRWWRLGVFRADSRALAPDPCRAKSRSSNHLDLPRKS